ncbi:hypothetical protein P3T23_008272 [Paraburkholderia sp. GAS448]|uniref:hypothetical protein n=1 Tax=Paraburkholderia sp. GAS448 TaxID=3035136 RepID=UPI003D198F98
MYGTEVSPTLISITGTQYAVFQVRDRSPGSRHIQTNDAHNRSPMEKHREPVGQHDNYEFALTAQPGGVARAARACAR